MPKISVIMPSLNVASYIEECMDSVLCQTLKDIEILCIDAGSADGTLEILERYAEKDRRIKLLHSTKKSYGHQINMGIEKASGEYIGIVETDDFIAPGMYEELYRLAVENDAEFVKSDFDVFITMPDGKRRYLTYSLPKYSSAEYNKIFSFHDYCLSPKTIDVFIWNGIYRKSFLIDNQIKLQETPGAAFQDCGFRYQVALQVERGYFTDKSFYRYRRDNINASSYSSKCLLYNLAECRNLMKFIKQRNITDKNKLCYLGREMEVIAYEPYKELLMRNAQVEGVKEALEGFRDIFRVFVEQGIITRKTVDNQRWLKICLLLKSLEAFDAYVQVKAEIEMEPIKEFLGHLAGEKHIILFGCGYVGACAYCFLRVNGLENIAAFCDNDKEKWGTEYMGCLVVSPKEAVSEYSDACFLIANKEHKDDIRSQLIGYGIAEKQICIYNQYTFPLACISSLNLDSIVRHA